MERKLLLSVAVLGKNPEKSVTFFVKKILIFSVGLGNCGKGAGNGSFERDSLSYSQQRSGLTFFSSSVLLSSTVQVENTPPAP